VANRIRKAGFKDPIMSESKEEIQERIIGMLAMMSLGQVPGNLAETILGKIPGSTKGNNEITEMLLTKQAEIMIIKITQITTTFETET
jgi:hypothetical protein